MATQAFSARPANRVQCLLVRVVILLVVACAACNESALVHAELDGGTTVATSDHAVAPAGAGAALAHPCSALSLDGRGWARGRAPAAVNPGDSLTVEAWLWDLGGVIYDEPLVAHGSYVSGP